MKRFILFIVFSTFSLVLFSQSTKVLSINIDAKYLTESIKANQILNDNNLQIENLKFYISDIKLLNDSLIVFNKDSSFHLIDISDENSLTLILDIPENTIYNHLEFNIGIDSMTNMSGVFGGDLDPTNGMYWTWQSGYINFKLEGKADNCPSRKNEFQYHLGGFSAPFNSIQKVNLKVGKKKDIHINIALDILFNQIDFNESSHIMSPSKKAMDLAIILPHIFSVQNED